MKRYTLSVETNMDFIALYGSDVRLTKVVTEIIAKDQEDLRAKVEDFLKSVGPFHGMETGLDKDQIEDLQTHRKEFENVLKHFGHSFPNWWNMTCIRVKEPRWELYLHFKGDL